MSARNRRDQKQLRRLRKALRVGLDSHINLIEYLTDRRIAKSRKEARSMCLEGRVRVESHVVGRLEVEDVAAPGGTRFILFPIVPAAARGRILVASK